MNVHLICLGSLKEDYLKQAQEILLGSVGRKNGISFCQVLELKEEPVKENASEAQIDAALTLEAARIREKIPPHARIICMDIGGKSTAPEFFTGLRRRMIESGQTELALIIGGSNGIHESVKRQAHHRISFSRLTYPHQLFRIAMLEALALYL